MSPRAKAAADAAPKKRKPRGARGKDLITSEPLITSEAITNPAEAVAKMLEASVHDDPADPAENGIATKALLRGEELVEYVNPRNLEISPHHRRRNWGDIAGLADSMRKVGVVQPLIVRWLPTGTIELIAGARRKRAAIQAGMAKVPVFVLQCSDEQALEMQIAENLQREDLHPMDEAEQFELLQAAGKTIERIAANAGRTPAHVRQRLQLCKLAPALRKRYLDDEIPHSVAYVLARFPDAEVQEEAVKAMHIAKEEGGDDEALEALAWQLRDRFMLELSRAAFDPNDETLAPHACTRCVYRSGAQAELFPDLVKHKGDFCLRPACHRDKVDAAWQRKSAEASKQGAQVLSQAESKEVFSQYGYLTDEGRKHYVLADETDYRTGKKWHQIMKKGATTVMAQAPDGKAVTLYLRKEAQKRQKEVEAKAREKNAGSAGQEVPSPSRRHAQAKQAAADKACAIIGLRAAQERVPPGLWPLLLQCCLNGSPAYVTVDDLAESRGFKSEDELLAAVDSWAASPEWEHEGAARSLLVESLVREHRHILYGANDADGQWPPILAQAAALYQVNLDDLVKMVEEEQAAAELATTAAASEKKAKGARKKKQSEVTA